MIPDEVNIHDGYNQIAPNATTVQQIIYGGDRFAERILDSKSRPLTLVVLGAGVDATLGLPTSATLIPRIVEYLDTDEGRQIDAILRKAIGRVRFHFDSFVTQSIDRMAKDLDKELVNICQGISAELRSNTSLTEDQHKLGRLIVILFGKILGIKDGATIDAETESLIEEVFGTSVRDEHIIDFSRINYTDTFKSIIVEILQKSMREADNPVLRHVYRNILDIEQLLSQYFYGFFTGQSGHIRNYLYISWMLWAYLVHAQQTITAALQDSIPTGIYARLGGQDCQLLSFNYTTFARSCSGSALYFHGSLSEYVDVENKNDLSVGDLQTLDLIQFFQNQLVRSVSLDGEHRSIPIPSFLPPLKLQPVISRRYIDTWYRASQMMYRADHIVILGCSLASADSFFCEALRANRTARITVIDKDTDTVARRLCRILHLPPEGYSLQTVDSQEHRIYDNRIRLIRSDLTEVNLSDWLAPEG